MKPAALIFIAIFLIFIFEFLIVKFPKKKWLKKWKFKGPVVILLVFLGLVAVSSINQPDVHCGKAHRTFTKPPVSLVTSVDYFMQANYDYDIGDCMRAVDDYTKAIRTSPTYEKAYNNRGYTYMRLREYGKAMDDFNKALEINPEYVNALINRGDLYNFYYDIDRKKALADYDKAMAIGGVDADSAKSLCSHRAIAIYGGLTPATYFKLLAKPKSHGCTIPSE